MGTVSTCTRWTDTLLASLNMQRKGALITPSIIKAACNRPRISSLLISLTQPIVEGIVLKFRLEKST
jgi:hypothetical protein